MKKIISVLCLLGLLAGCLCLFTGCKRDDSVPDGMKNVAGKQDPYCFYVPQSWVTNSNGIVGAYYSVGDPSNVSVMAYGGQFASSADYWKDFTTRAASVFSSFEIVEENISRLISGKAALQYVYKMTLDGVRYQCMQTVVVYSNMMYVITYTATEDLYNTHADEVGKMLDHFVFL